MMPVRPATLASIVAVAIAALPAAASWVDPIAPQSHAPSESLPPQVERVEEPADTVQPPVVSETEVHDRAVAAMDAHLLITGRPVQGDDGEVESAPEPEGGAEPVLRYHPATLFEVAMGVVMAVVALSLVWLPQLRRRRRGHHRGRRREGSRRRVVSEATRPAAPATVATRSRRRRRSRRAAAGLTARRG